MDAFDGLADPVRRRLLTALAVGPLTAGELAAGEPISRPAVSRHLRVLLESGLVAVTAEGRHRRYRLRPESLDTVEAFCAALRRPPVAASALDALELEVRRTVRDHATARPDEEEIA
ncbi:helix-turn-helix protein [Diaminobutyricimonas aerilata]|uniref:Helix-turn-helix protein n=1 Tax=Diaminobutyricimonas aerilata TaxID=1162967 RepID=A0A2M9CGP2_9MICO|nr:metalloregulator ArsR/SmtB family transcription factor [Diaminobutyricimonas aerilata]PJJ71093.1 helix-turn-helix protein [Diaminobutyricimonas aerilata]